MIELRLPNGSTWAVGWPLPLNTDVLRLLYGSITALRFPDASHVRLVRLPRLSMNAVRWLLVSTTKLNRPPAGSVTACSLVVRLVIVAWVMVVRLPRGSTTAVSWPEFQMYDVRLDCGAIRGVMLRLVSVTTDVLFPAGSVTVMARPL